MSMQVTVPELWPPTFLGLRRQLAFRVSFCCPAVQKANHAEINEAVNGLLIDEEDFEGLKHSIITYDNFDQVGQT
jgi:hypothetical protein